MKIQEEGVTVVIISLALPVMPSSSSPLHTLHTSFSHTHCTHLTTPLHCTAHTLTMHCTFFFYTRLPLSSLPLPLGEGKKGRQAHPVREGERGKLAMPRAFPACPLPPPPPPPAPTPTPPCPCLPHPHASLTTSVTPSPGRVCLRWSGSWVRWVLQRRRGGEEAPPSIPCLP